MATKLNALDVYKYYYIKVWYRAINGKEGFYECWSNRNKTKHYWQALGNYGEEPSGFEAMEKAKDWIANGIASLPQTPKN